MGSTANIRTRLTLKSRMLEKNHMMTPMATAQTKVHSLKKVERESAQRRERCSVDN